MLLSSSNTRRHKKLLRLSAVYLNKVVYLLWKSVKPKADIGISTPSFWQARMARRLTETHSILNIKIYKLKHILASLDSFHSSFLLSLLWYPENLFDNVFPP